jgi:hypothetical protein
MFEWNAFELGVQNPLYSSWVHSLILPHQPHQPHHHVCIKLYCFYKYSFFLFCIIWLLNPPWEMEWAKCATPIPFNSNIVLGSFYWPSIFSMQ